MENNLSNTITLTLTEACNLNCIYCYEHNKQAKTMSIPLAKQIIDRELGASSADVTILDFFGGEPFLAFEVMRQLVDYVFSKQWPTKVICSTGTNGTLIHGDIQKWLYENRHRLCVGLSFDGTKEMQNVNRCNSFELIDLSFFHQCWPEQTVKMTLSPQTIDTLADGVIFLHEHGFEVACNLAYGLDWTSPNNISALSRELMKLVNYYLEHPEITPCTMLSMGIQHIDGSIPKIIKKWCGAGTHMRTYDVEGNIYPCHFFMPLSIGEEKTKKSKQVNIVSDIPIESLWDKCAKCPFVVACPTCIGSNYYETGNLYTKNESYCRCIKTIMAANSYFKWKQMENGSLSLSETEKIRLLRGIKVIQEQIEMNE